MGILCSVLELQEADVMYGLGWTRCNMSLKKRCQNLGHTLCIKVTSVISKALVVLHFSVTIVSFWLSLSYGTCCYYAGSFVELSYLLWFANINWRLFWLAVEDCLWLRSLMV